MYTIDDLINYYKNNLAYCTINIKTPEKYLCEVFKGIDKKYIDLIVKKLSLEKIKFVNSKNNSLSVFYKLLSITLNSKTQKEVVFHEFGHLIDYIRLETIQNNYKNENKKIINESNERILSNGKTLNDTIKLEVKNIGSKAYEKLIELYNKDVLGSLSQEDLHKYHYLKDIYEEYKKLKCKIRYAKNVPTRVEIQYKNKKYADRINIIDLSKFKDKDDALKTLHRIDQLDLELGNYKEYNAIMTKVCKINEYKAFIDDYNVVIDALGSLYDLHSILPSHTRGYYKNYGMLGSEFFANCFAMTLANNYNRINKTKEFLPESYKMFLELNELIKKEK